MVVFRIVAGGRDMPEAGEHGGHRPVKAPWFMPAKNGPAARGEPEPVVGHAVAAVPAFKAPVPGSSLGRRLKLSQLRAIGTIAAVGSIAEAARQIGVTQSAMSKMLREIEEEVGLSLFIRHPRGAEITPAGQRVDETARRVATELERLACDLEQMAGRKVAGVMLGALPTAASGVVSAVLARFKAYRPEAAVQVVQGWSDILLPELRAGRLDLVIGRLYVPAAPDGLIREALYDETMAILARTGHPLFADGQPALHRLSAFDFVLPTVSQRLGVEIEAIMAGLGLASDRALRTSSSAVLREMLHTGNYLTILPRLMMAGDLDRGTLQALPVPLPTPGRPAGVIHRGHATLGPDARALVRALQRYLAEPHEQTPGRPSPPGRADP